MDREFYRRWMFLLLVLWFIPPVFCVAQVVETNPATHSVEADYRVALFLPHSSNFWDRFESFARAAADDIGLQLEVYHAGTSTKRMLEQVRTAATDGVDAILFMEFQGVGTSILEIAERHEIPALLFNTGLDEKSLLPRVHYKHWIGGVVPNDRQAGIRLITHLLNAADKEGAKVFSVLAYSGRAESRAHSRRLEGLESVVDARSDVMLVDTLPDSNDAPMAARRFEKALIEYPEINIVWSHNDQHALAAAVHYQKLGRAEPIVFGGIDWTPEAVSSVIDGKLDVNIGGHVFDGAQSVVMIFDYLNGHDFAEEKLLFDSNMIAINSQNAHRFRQVLADPEAINYKSLSKTHNPILQQYRFELNEVAETAMTRIKLTSEEKRWIREHPTVRIGGESDWPPFDFVDKMGIHQGLTADYLALLSQKLGVKFEVVTDNPWPTTLEMLKNRQLDAIGAISRNHEREQFTLFTQPYNELSMAIFTRKDHPVNNSLIDLLNIKVAIERDFVNHDTLRRDYPNVPLLEVNTTLEALESVSQGRADAYIGTLAVATYLLGKHSITNIRVAGKPTFDNTGISIGVRSDWPVLATILDKALNEITAREHIEIRRRWITIDSSSLITERSAVELTQEETAWIKAHPVISLGVDPEFAPFEFLDEKGNYQGLASDYITILNKRLGLNMQVLPGLSWNEAVAKAKKREIDILPTIGRSQERETYLNFSKPYIHFLRAIITRSNTPLLISGVDDLQGLRVAVQANSSHEGYLRDYSDIEPITYSTLQASLMALSNGEVDAFIGNVASATHWIRKMNLINLKVAVQVSQDIQNLHFGIRNDWPELVSILNKGLNSITAAERIKIRNRWISLGISPSASTRKAIKFTPKETAWLRQHPEVRFTGGPNWLPFEAFTEQGEFIGITSEILNNLEQRTGVKFKRLPSGTWLNALNMFKNGEVDIISDDVEVEDIHGTHTFTRPYLERPLAIVMRSEQTEIIPDLNHIADKRIAVIDGYGYVGKLSQRYPEIDFIKVENIQDGLIGLSSDHLDALVVTFTAGSYHINQMGMSNLRIVGNLPVVMKMGLAVRSDWPELLAILNKAIDLITPAEKHEIVNRWMQDKYIDHIDYRLVWQVVVVAAAILFFILLWGYTMQRQKERLRISEERFQLAMAAASDGLWDRNITTGDTYYSPGYMAMLGYSAGELAGHKETWEDLLHPEDKEVALAVMEEAINSNASRYEHEFRLRSKDGVYRNILSKGAVVSRDEQGMALRLVGTQTDITERKQADDTLRKLSRAVEQSPSMVVITDCTGVIEYVNPKFTEVTGYEAEQAIGQTTTLLKSGYTPDAVYKDMWQTILAGRNWHGELQNRKQNGEIYWERETISPLVDDNGVVHHYVAVKEDITASRLVEENLRVFQRFAETSGQGFGITTLDGDITYANQTMCLMLEEESATDVCSQNYARYFPADVQTRFRQEIMPILKEKNQWTGELTLVTATGRQIPTLENLFVIRDENSKASYFGNVITDITLQKNTEQALQNAKEQAELANRFKSEFLANMSHEIRTPLNAIMGMAYLAHQTELTPRQHDYLNNILSSSRALLGVINDILDFSKIEAGHLDMEKTDFLLEGVFESLSNLESMRAAEKGVEIIYDIDKEVPRTLVGDPLRLGQVLINLTSNALKFTEHGQVVVAVVLQKVHADRVVLRFSVQDSGIGIERSQVAHLFAPFTQADGSTTRKYGGTGLGLAISKQLVTMMNGEIGVESEPGSGSTFYFSAEFGLSNSEIKTEFMPTPDLRGMRVLVVDDNAIARQTLQAMLESFSFRVTTVASGAAALAELEHAGSEESETFYKLVLMDWKMPGMDGVKASRLIRRSDWLPQLPTIIMVTAYGREEVVHAAAQAGIERFLVKPVSPSTLLDIIVDTMAPEAGSAPVSLQRKSIVPDLRGASVLVVEDNRINQQVAQEMLEAAGIKVTVVNNGAMAVQAVRTNSFDLVLMDLQMPDMDGYQATRMIRKDPQFKQLPIVAMTAHAMTGDREKCLEAGMNDHLPKPIDPDLLYATLKKWIILPEEVTCQTRQVNDKRKEPYEGDILLPASLPGIDIDKGLLRIGGNRQLFRTLLLELVEDHCDDDTALIKALETGDKAQARRIVHTLRSVAGSIGAELFEKRAEALESAFIKEDSYTELLTLFAAEFRVVFNGLIDSLELLAAKVSPGEVKKSEKAGQWWESARKLELELIEGSIEAKESLSRCRPYLRQHTTEAKVGLLEDQIKNYDFDDALTTLQEIIGNANNKANP